MGNRRYGQVPLSLWKRPAFKALPEDSKLAVLYFWCGPHSTSAGIGEFPDLYAMADLTWTIERWTAARDAAEQSGFIKRDAATETVFVNDYLTTNRPSNAKHRAAIVGQISSIECSNLRELAEAALVQIDTQAKHLPQTQRQSDLSPKLRALVGGSN